MEKGYKATKPDGKEVAVTIPPRLSEEEEFFEHITSFLSPEAVAAIIAYIDGFNLYERPKTDDSPEQKNLIIQTVTEVKWFQKFLLDHIGVKEYNQIIEELHL